MTNFYNPYHFVPVTDKKRCNDLCRNEFDEKKKPEERKATHLTHDRYINKTSFNDKEQEVYSGRLICHIITRDPIFIGSKRDDSVTPHKVSHFELSKGKPAIPASTIRGMISSIAEAASNSALRVLEEKYYSYRAEMREALGAIGMIVKETAEDGKAVLKLRPLALPSLPWRDNRARILNEYQKMFIKPMLKVYINGYEEQDKKITKDPNSFLAKNDLNSYCADRQEFWYIKLDGKCSLNGNVVTCTKEPHIKQITTKRGETFYFLNGQKALCDPISEKEYKDITDPNEKCKYTRGILRILGIEGRDDSIPADTKKHEIFIPYPEGIENYPTFDVQDAITRFEKIAEERAETSSSDKKENINEKLPYSLKGSKRNDDLVEDKDKNNIKVRDGDIVFFKASNSGIIDEIAISSIWRKSNGKSSHDYFKAVCPELLPFNPKREWITIAEQLFGFVEQMPKNKDEKEDNKEEPALSFASRLRFSFGILDKNEKEPYQTEEVLLKILDSPKPPCPSFYFKPKNVTSGNNFIAKKSLNPCEHIPQGRKFYLHKHDASDKPWETQHENEGQDRKSRISPLRTGLNFYFHIDFDNLSRRELSLLCYALKPSENYRHKIGMGKPIGLGKIEIIPEGLFIIDRKKRYSEDDIFSSNRYHKSWVREPENFAKLTDTYKKEKQAVNLDTMDSFEELRKDFEDSMDPDIKKALELIGDPNNVKCSVHTPQVIKAGTDLEQKTYEWFMANEKLGSQRGYGLKPLDRDSEDLQALPRLPRPR